MTDKQIIIDYENICENYSKEVGCYNTFDGNCIKEQCFTYRLLQLLKTKEQECEDLNKWKENVINLFDKTCRCKYLNEESTYCSFYNKECIAINQCLYKNQQTLTEIKDYCNKYPQNSIGFKKQILQKINNVLNEVSNDMENN